AFPESSLRPQAVRPARRMRPAAAAYMMSVLKGEVLVFMVGPVGGCLWTYLSINRLGVKRYFRFFSRETRACFYSSRSVSPALRRGQPAIRPVSIWRGSGGAARCHIREKTDFPLAEIKRYGYPLREPRTDRKKDFMLSLSLSNTAEYALRAMTMLALEAGGGAINARDLSGKTRVPVHYLNKIMNRLVEAGLVT